MSKDLLLEIGVEEIPHEILSETIGQLKQIALEKLQTAGLEFGKIYVYGTPRRLTACLTDVAEKTAQKTSEKKGPAVNAAFDKDGNPTKALEGFLRGQNAQLNEIEEKDFNGNMYVVLSRDEGGEPADKILPAVWKDIILSIPFPKAMRWATYQTAFVRPIRWIVCLFGGEILPLNIENITAGRFSRGHRLLSNESFEITESGDYKNLLKEKNVIVDQDERKDIIRDKVEKTALRLHAVPVLSDRLLDTLVCLTEYPEVAVAEFEKEFLPLPQEVLISEMVDHQKFIPLTDKLGNLINNFIVITNNKPNENMVAGNERVIRARFSDGKFFFDEDRKKTLSDHLPQLANVAFGKGLGSVLDKVGRLKEIVTVLAKLMKFDPALDDTLRAAELCKADLVTGMVNEFDELQGVMGYYYALHSGEQKNVAIAIKEHYLPRFSGDELPSAPEGIMVSLADRIDNLFAIYSQGKFVTGSKDPFALRRQTLGIIRILIEKQLHLDFAVLFDKIMSLYKDFLSIEEEEFRTQILNFITTRIKTVFKEYQLDYDEIEAGIPSDVSDIYDSYLRVQAIHQVRKSQDFTDLAVAFKRIKNIIRDQKAGKIDPARLSVDAEKKLYDFYLKNEKQFKDSVDKKDYSASVTILTSFRTPVDKFFDDVLVMDEDLQVRSNRVALLSHIDSLFASFIDFDKIVVE